MTDASTVAHRPGRAWWWKLTRQAEARPSGVEEAETTGTRAGSEAHYAWLLPGDVLITNQ
ncbi:hypothetical protein [Arthrobacter pityocampae]|uniref:hypothetical protein n=1 Tax=Arthrobacter pityocampae TaxID=547334 RepID=UPI003735DFAD